MLSHISGESTAETAPHSKTIKILKGTMNKSQLLSNDTGYVRTHPRADPSCPKEVATGIYCICVCKHMKQTAPRMGENWAPVNVNVTDQALGEPDEQ